MKSKWYKSIKPSFGLRIKIFHFKKLPTSCKKLIFSSKKNFISTLCEPKFATTLNVIQLIHDFDKNRNLKYITKYIFKISFTWVAQKFLFNS